ncbi:diphthine synthase, partial [Candidatus Woesearchaeota archaeon CG11_big_fil_rev_8_21_14_0_20_57_5]
HIELAMEARRQGIPCRIIHGASILTAVAETGLQAYKFGKVGSVVFPPRSNSTAYEVLEKNLSIGLHTLLLLDLDGDRYMDAAEAVEALLQEEQQTGKGLLQKDTQVVVCAGLGTSDARIWVGHADSVQRSGPYPQCLVIPGNLHFAEKDALASHTVPER